jgi:hypothetical protein
VNAVRRPAPDGQYREHQKETVSQLSYGQKHDTDYLYSDNRPDSSQAALSLRACGHHGQHLSRKVPFSVIGEIIETIQRIGRPD